MSKVGEQQREIDEINGPMEEPSDAELQEIESTLTEYDNWTDPDVELGQLLQVVTIFLQKKVVWHIKSVVYYSC